MLCFRFKVLFCCMLNLMLAYLLEKELLVESAIFSLLQCFEEFLLNFHWDSVILGELFHLRLSLQTDFLDLFLTQISLKL